MYRVLHWVSKTSLLLAIAGVATALLAPEIQAARDNARRSPCKNTLFQHSGAHGYEYAYLTRDLHVTAVGSCPVCYRPGAGLFFVIDGESTRFYSGVESFPPPEVVREAQRQLAVYRRQPRYREIRGLFGP